MRHIFRTAVTLSVVLSITAGGQRAFMRAVAGQEPPPAEDASSQLRGPAEEVLWWLPEDTQTVRVARGPFSLLPPAPEPGADCSFQGVTLGKLQEYAKPLAGRAVALAMSGSRRFRMTRDLGPMPYQGCHILMFVEDRGAQGVEFMRSMEAKAAKVDSLAGERVLIFQEKIEQDDWTFYLTQPKPLLVLLATDRNYLETVLQRSKHRARTRALPADLPEWKQVDLAARYFGLRHFDRNDVAHDPTSPFTGGCTGIKDSRAIGLAYSFDSERGKGVVIRYLTTNPKALSIVEAQWRRTDPNERLLPAIRRRQGDAVEISMPAEQLGDKLQLGMLTLMLMCFLGHGVSL